MKMEHIERVELDRIYSAVEKEIGVTRLAIKTKAYGSRNVSAARRAVCILMRDRLAWTKQQIAEEINRSPLRVANMLYSTGVCSRHYISEETINHYQEIENRIRAALRQ